MARLHENDGITRRKFLSYASLPAITCFVPAIASADRENLLSKGNNGLAFADRNGMGPYVDALTVESQYQPLHGEQRITSQIFQSDEIEMMKATLSSEFRKDGIEWDNSFHLGYSYQHYGVPDNSRLGRQLLAYCEQVHDFLYARVDGLFDVKIPWTLLDSEQSGELTSKQFIGHVGRYTYYVIRVFVDYPGLDGAPSLLNAQPLERAIHYIVGGESALPKHGHLYIIPGKTSLVAPFSELLHLTFHAPSEHYEEQLGKTLPREEARKNAINAGETINEAMSIILAKEYIEKYFDGKKTAAINDMAINLTARFNNLDRAIAFINKHSVQKTMDLYLENPAAFMDLLTKV